MNCSLHRWSVLLLFVAAVIGSASAGADNPRAGRIDLSPREEILLNADWRFNRDDEPSTAISPQYDVRPEVKERRDDVPADSQPTAAEKPKGAAQPVLKPWILPTGNAFIRDPARRHARPPQNWPGEVPFAQREFDDTNWHRVDLPHDWAIAGPFIPTGDLGGMGRLPTTGVGWYRKKIHIPASDAGKSIFLDVEGAMSYASVWLNGQIVGGWPHGYSSWRVDLTPYVRLGEENQLAIRLDNPPQSSRWYPGAGLYRNVWLIKTQSLHVGQWGTYVSTRDVSPTAATIDVAVTIDNDSATARSATVSTVLYALDEFGAKLGDAVARVAPATASVPARGSSLVSGSVTLSNPRLWGPPPNQRPHLYLAVTTVSEAAQVTDTYVTRFGIRDLRFDPNWGVYVNGERVKIRGVNNHHDLGALGAAFNRRAAERQLEILREMGCNAIRMSHNPPAPELLQLTDEMGFLVMDEMFDMWERKKTPLDFHLVFPEWHEQDLRAMLRRDRNSPSVIIWSIGNEVGEQYTGEEGAAIAKRLCDIVREEDPTRPTTTAMNYAKPDMPLPAVVDIISLNYQGEGIRFSPEFEGTTRIRTPPQYLAYRQKFPSKVILSSETASAFSSRGVYLFPVTKETSAPVRDGRGGDSTIRHVSAYELHAVDFGSSAEKVFASLERHPFVAGEFVWTGWDHLGEPTPYYSSRSSYAGIIDLAGFKKDRFYLYQSHWRPDFPMAHILPHWTWPDRVGEVTPIHVFTSGDEAEVFLNGKSLGRKAKQQFEYRLRWDEVVYEPGVVEVVAYKDGKVWAKDSVRTADEAARLELEPDRAEIAADGLDLSFVTARITDRQGNLAPRADHRITFSVKGPGEIVATDNGDPTNFESFASPTRHAFSGLCLVIIRGKPGEPGSIEVTASADGLETAQTHILAGPRGNQR
jgi:beta-galactosidase